MASHLDRKSTARALALLESALLIYFSLLPASQLPRTGIEAPREGDLEHFLAYGVYAFLLAGAFPGRKAILWAFLAAAGMGLLTEAIQLLVPTRLFDPLDVLADAAGAAAGLAALRLHGRKMPTLPPAKPLLPVFQSLTVRPKSSLL